MHTYAQNFEDVMLERLFRGQPDGFYVDVGAWDPNVYSVTKHFYLKGWRGVNVEPMRARFEMFVDARPRDVNLNVAVSDRPGDLRFFECVEESYLSTVNAEVADEMQARGLTGRSYSVPSVTLNDVLDIHCPPRVDFVKIDVEGWELNVIRGCDWRRHRPRVLVVEATKPATPLLDWEHPEAIANWDTWEPILLDAGYVFAHFDGLSRFYVRKEEGHLATRLRIPPCFFDDIHSQEVVELRRRIAELQKSRWRKLGLRLGIVKRASFEQ